jgi:hypothetical protein
MMETMAPMVWTTGMGVIVAISFMMEAHESQIKHVWEKCTNTLTDFKAESSEV